MKFIKNIVVELELELLDGDNPCNSDAFIKQDLEQEIACCTNLYDVKNIEITTAIAR